MGRGEGRKVCVDMEVVCQALSQICSVTIRVTVRWWQGEGESSVRSLSALTPLIRWPIAVTIWRDTLLFSISTSAAWPMVLIGW